MGGNGDEICAREIITKIINKKNQLNLYGSSGFFFSGIDKKYFVFYYLTHVT